MASSSSSPPPSSQIQDIISILASEGLSPRTVLSHLAPSVQVPPGADDETVYGLIAAVLEPPRRKKLPQYNTLEDAVDLIKRSKNIIVLSGAGISTSAGLPDFRSRNGIYVQIHEEFPDLTDPKLIFDINYFKKNPSPFFDFARSLYPGQFRPTIGHQFIKCIEDHKKLLRNYTQNIDTLEKQAGIKRVVECHGSFAKASCTNCKYTVDGEDIREDVFAKKVPTCPRCDTLEDGPQETLGVLKPNIVFFGEQLGNEFHDSFEADQGRADLLIVIGSSLKVRPVANIPRSIPNVPQILINKEKLVALGDSFDIELLGDSDLIIQQLCLRLAGGWTRICEPDTKLLKEIQWSEQLKMTKSVADDKLQSDVGTKVHENSKEANTRNSDGAKVTDSPDDSSSPMDTAQDIETVSISSSTDVSSDTMSLSDSEKAGKVDLLVPESSFVHLKPNIYLFKGAELPNARFLDYSMGAQKQD